MRPSEIRPDGFRHAASGEAAVLISVRWHCEDSPLKIIYVREIVILKRGKLTR